MQLKHIAALAAAASSVSAQQSICDKYTIALLKTNSAANQYTLLSLLVNTAVIGNFTGPGTTNSMLPGSMVDVPGILAPAGGLLKYFDGSLLSTNSGGKTGVSQSFLDGGGAAYIIANPTMGGMAGTSQATLLDHLYQFFGALLGCSQYGMGAFPSYAGDSNMASVHQFMVIDSAEFTYFVQQVGLAALSFGVTTADATAAGTALTNAFGKRCSPAAAILPTAPKQPQAICQAADCPEASSPACSLYPSEAEPAAASSSAAASATAAPTYGASSATPVTTAAPVYSASAAVSQISDGQPQVSSPAPAVSQISDGQPQVTAPVPAYTGAAVKAGPVAGAVLLAAAAFAL